MGFWGWLEEGLGGPRRLRELIQRHLRINVGEAQSVTHNVKPVERVNLQRVVDRWAAESVPVARVFGYSAAGYYAGDDVMRHLLNDELIQAPVERSRIESGPGESLDCVLRGLYLLRRSRVPVVVMFRPSGWMSEKLPVVEVIAATRAAARDTLTALLDEAQRGSVYRGRTISISLEQSTLFSEGCSIRFHELHPTAREQIVLPEELLRVVERNVLGMLKHAAALRAAGRSLRRGLLFHGPPGTGKTMVIRYLAGACADHTVILLTGARQGQPGVLRDACHVARLLAPSIVVLEDVDLVAEDRQTNSCPAVLQELLNEMDGLESREEVTFLLTTNRPEVLEPALAARPGRIDQAIAFPLPDEQCRRRLFEVYGQGLDLSGVDLGRWVSQTNGVSPAFLEELLRKAALMAAERGEAENPMRLRDADVQNAIRELVYFGGELTQKLLGYRLGRIGYQAGAEASSGA